MHYQNINYKSEYYESIKEDIKSLIQDNLDYIEHSNFEEFEESLKDSGTYDQCIDNNLIFCADHDKILEFTDNDEAYEDMGFELKGSFIEIEIKQIVARCAHSYDFAEVWDEIAESVYNELMEV